MAIVVLGLALVPFLKIIVNSELDSKRLIIYYLLFLANTVASYAFTYRKQVLAADQKQYILNTCNNVVVSLMYVFQIIFLIISKNYLIFLIVQVVFTFAEGLICNIFVCRNYPYLKQRYEKNIDKIEFPELKKTVIMTFVGRVSDVLITQTDSILISTIINTVTVGFYSNYYLLITYIVNYFGVATSGIIASFGNLQTEDNKEKSYRYFIMLVTGFGLTATLCSVCFICVIQDFIVIWIGKKYLLNMWFVLALVINFFVLIMTNPLYIYKDTLGIFKKGQYARLIGAIINIVLSIVLGIKIGLVGIIIATPISRLLTYFWYDGFVLMHFYGKKMREYIALMGKVFVSAILVVLSLIFIVWILRLISKSRVGKSEYDKYIGKLLNEYDRLIVETSSAPITKDKNIIEIKEFKELLDVRDNLNLPIKYYVITKHQKCNFYISHEEELYLLTIKAVDVKKEKNKFFRIK